MRPGDRSCSSRARSSTAGSGSCSRRPDFQPADAVEPAPRGPDRAGLPAHDRRDRQPPAGRDAPGARRGRDAVPRVPPRRAADRRSGLPPIGEALEAAHFPSTFEARDAALRRLAFDELLALQLGMVGRRRARGRSRTQPVAGDAGRRRADPGLARGVARPGSWATRRRSRADQARTIDEIRDDLARRDADAPARPGRRRLGQDGGRGVGRSRRPRSTGRQAALLAPTDLLARQHHETVGRPARGPRASR